MNVHSLRRVCTPAIGAAALTVLAAATDARADGPVGRKVRSSSSSSSSSSPYDSASTGTTIDDRFKGFRDDIESCDELASALAPGCPRDLFAGPIGCLRDLREDLQKWAEVNKSNISYVPEDASIPTHAALVERIDQRIARLERMRDQKAKRRSIAQCRARTSRWTVGWQVFGVDPASYAPIQGKIETPGSWGYGSSLRVMTDGLWVLSGDQDMWLDWDFLFEYQTVPLKRRSFGDNNDVTFNEDIEWMRVQPFSLVFSWFREPSRSSTWMDMVAVRASLGPSYVRAALSQDMESNYEEDGTDRSDTIGSLYVPVMSAFGYQMHVKAFVPVYWHIGIAAEARVNDYPKMYFSHPERVAHKVTFEDLQQNNRYTWYDYGVHVATRNTSFGVDAGYIWTFIRGSGGTGINNRTVLLNLSWSWDVVHDTPRVGASDPPGGDREDAVHEQPSTKPAEESEAGSEPEAAEPEAAEPEPAKDSEPPPEPSQPDVPPTEPPEEP